MTINEIEATGEEERDRKRVKAKIHEGDMKSLRQAGKKTGRWRREMKGNRK